MWVGEGKLHKSIEPKKSSQQGIKQIERFFKLCRDIVITFQSVLDSHFNSAQHQGLFSSASVLVTNNISTSDIFSQTKTKSLSNSVPCRGWGSKNDSLTGHNGIRYGGFAFVFVHTYVGV